MSDRFGFGGLVVLCLLSILSLGGATARAQSESDRIRELEKQIEQLRHDLEALRQAQAPAPATEPQPPAEATTPPASAPTAAELPGAAELARRIDVLAEEVAALKTGDTMPLADRSDVGLGPAASKVYRKDHGVAIGGYGEVLYQNFDDSHDDGIAAGERDELTLERAVLYVGYKFADRWLFNSELEWEEGGEEASVELAYLDYQWRDALGFRFGHLLAPMGFINEMHEPTIYLGAKRPLVERLVIPTTWHASGAGVHGEHGPLSYRSYVLTGFDATGFTADEGLREGRQAGEVTAEDFALTGRLDWHAADGLLLGGSFYTGNSGQGLVDGGPLEGGGGGHELDVPTQIFEGHGEWRWRGLETRLLAARAHVGDVARLNRFLGFQGAQSVGEELTGWYAQVGYDLFSRRAEGTGRFIPFVRWEAVDTQHEVPSGFDRDPANDRTILTLGLHYQPIDPVVFKLDYQNADDGAGRGLDQLNLGVGYVF